MIETVRVTDEEARQGVLMVGEEVAAMQGRIDAMQADLERLRAAIEWVQRVMVDEVDDGK